MDQTELDLREIFHRLRRRIWLLVALPLLAAIAAGAVSTYVLKPVYSASTTMWVIKNDAGQVNLNDVMLSRNLTKTYAEIAGSRSVMAAVIDRLHLQGVTVEELTAKLTVSPVRDTEIIMFTILDGDPAMATRLADAVAQSVKEQISSFMKGQNVVVVDPAHALPSPVKPRPVLNVAIAGVLGLMAAMALAFLLEYLDTSIKTPDDVARYVGVPMLGMIPAISTGAAPAAASRRDSSARRNREEVRS